MASRFRLIRLPLCRTPASGGWELKAAGAITDEVGPRENLYGAGRCEGRGDAVTT